MARGPVFHDDAVMVKCARCGTENAAGNAFCQSCGSTLTESDAVRTATLEEPAVSIPDWVFPSRVGEKAGAGQKAPPGRVWKFALLLVAFLGIFVVAPGLGIWKTSPFLREIGIGDYFSRLPSCEESARAAGEDPVLCQQTEQQVAFRIATKEVRDERYRNVWFAATGAGVLALATLLLVLAAGLRPWWAFAVIVSPLNLFVWGWAAWRLSAWPVRTWEPAR